MAVPQLRHRDVGFRLGTNTAVHAGDVISNVQRRAPRAPTQASTAMDPAEAASITILNCGFILHEFTFVHVFGSHSDLRTPICLKYQGLQIGSHLIK